MKYRGIPASKRVEDRRQKLMAAGLEAFGTTGYAKSSIKSICDLAGLTERYFYESFRNKEALLGCVYSGIVDEIIEKALKSAGRPHLEPREIVLKALEAYYGSLWEDPRKARVIYFEVLGKSPEIDRRYRDARDRVEEIISFLISKAFPEIDPEYLNTTIIPTALAGAVNLIAERWVLDDLRTPLQDILDQVSFWVEAFEELSRSPSLSGLRGNDRRLE